MAPFSGTEKTTTSFLASANFQLNKKNKKGKREKKLSLFLLDY
jgi:hypothetical protein